jgi:hypothetical protein
MRVDVIIISIGASVVGAVLSGIVANECKAWIAYLPKWLIRRAIAWVPQESRERYTEEWLSHISEVPGDIGKIVTAVGFVWAAKKMPANTAATGALIVPGVREPNVGNAACRIEVQAGIRTSGTVTVRLERPSEQNPPSTQG